ncbi:hypothetical protein CAEBREN_25558 [Caenorhabditis brenneri]|uniref:Uncharacterized protein n=1 Tax=Caenorhabditis brenneri TaxID=135651 RepID=G0MC79_CAEBE|nr:hypothetical protein CAEBREN_25558 [Caenorhabditis brenneri]
MFFQGSIQLSILIIQYIIITFGKIIALLLGVILIFLRYLWENEVIILSVFNKEIRLDLIEISFFTCTVTCALIYFLSLKIGKKAKVDRKTISVFVHFIVFVWFYTVCLMAVFTNKNKFKAFLISTTFKLWLFNFTFWFSPEVDMFISDIYYFPFLWIISAHICGSKRIQKLIRDSEKSESQAFQMAQIPVTKKVDNEKTTISYLSLADISIVV